MRSILILLLLALATPALAVDGVLEINQTCAVNTGCFADDAPGFPVTIAASGSDRLTSNLHVSQEPRVVTEGAIRITGDHVTLDLGGFEISCLLLSPPAEPCTGSATGVRSAGARNIVVRNGTIRDMPMNGIFISDPDATIEYVRAHDNGNAGISIFTGVIRFSQAINNGNGGLVSTGGGMIYQSEARDNSGVDVSGRTRNSIYRIPSTGTLFTDLGGNYDIP